MFKKIFSYIIPINIYKKKSSVNKSIEITWTNGKLVLNSKNTNYSYGSLQRILRKGLQSIGYQKITNMKQILVLGIAGGSVIKTLIDEIKFKESITAVDIDKEIIDVANQFYKLNDYSNLTIHIMDAFEFVMKTKVKYDLIIIDIFQDITMPDFLFDFVFINKITDILNPKGFILFNTMILDKTQNIRNKNYIKAYNSNYFSIRKISHIERYNELIIIEKIENNLPLPL